MSDPHQPLSVLREYVERSTHWTEGGVTRHDALKIALPALEDALSELEDRVDWLEKGNGEWRSVALTRGQHLAAVQATARVAIGHLQAVLNKPRTADEQMAADALARDWLISIGSEPN